MSKTNTMGFEALFVAPEICSILRKLNITTPTPIQEKSIPIGMAGEDLIGIAQTGTGKTLAFGLPMLARLRQGQVGLVLAPTRELAQQIAETFEKLGERPILVVGGAGMNRQVQQLRRPHRIIVATPGRLTDHLHQGTLTLNRVSIVVLDEGDRMLDMGFAPAIHRILAQIPGERQTMLFSATMPREIEEMANTYQKNPKRVEVAPSGTASELVDQELIFLEHEEKAPMLAELLYENTGTVLVFARTRHGARKLAKAVRTDGHTATELHADRSLAQRREALQGFKNGDYRVLVATDIAARGIDVKEISLVINFDVPEKAEDYVHRIGRTGRMGAKGRAIMLAIPQQSKDVADIERLMGSVLIVSDRSTVVPHIARVGVRNKPGASGRQQQQPQSPARPKIQMTRRPEPKPEPRSEQRTEPKDVAPRPRPHGTGKPNSNPGRPKYRPAGPAAPASSTPTGSTRKPHRGWSGKPKPAKSGRRKR